MFHTNYIFVFHPTRATHQQLFIHDVKKKNFLKLVDAAHSINSYIETSTSSEEFMIFEWDRFSHLRVKRYPLLCGLVSVYVMAILKSMIERDDEDEKVKHNNASLPTLQYFHFTTHE